MSCKNVKECPCPKTTCQNNAKCCDCVKRHKNDNGLPFCLRPAKQEN